MRYNPDKHFANRYNKSYYQFNKLFHYNVVLMQDKMDRKNITVGKSSELEKKDTEYWKKASVEEKLQTITYLRECFYGIEATTGRLQRFYKVFKRT
jgi:hypothetical protein